MLRKSWKKKEQRKKIEKENSKKKLEEERAKKKIENAKKMLDEERAKKKIEKENAKKMLDEEKAKKKLEKENAKKKLEEERAKKKIEKENAKKKLDEEKAKKKIEKENAKKMLDEEKAKKKIEKENAKKMLDEEKAEKENAKKKLEEEKAEKENAKKKLEEEKAEKENTINISELKDEWYDLYHKLKRKYPENVLLNTPLTINENVNNILNVRLSRTEKVIGLTGKGTFILRKFRDMGMAKNEVLNIYLPKNYNNKKFVNPIWNVKHGYMYYNNDVNLKILKITVEIINILNKKFKNYKLSNSSVDVKKSEGIIGIDIEYMESEWVTKLIKGDKIHNPIINKDKQIIFSKSMITLKTVELATKFLNKRLDSFKDIYEKYILLKTTKRVSLELEEFIKSDKKIGLIAYDKHARIIFKKDNNLFIIDPWKQTIDKGTKDLMNLLPNLSFIKRKSEQTTEGSCVAVSYARALYMADKGIDVINNEIPFDYIVLTSRLISKFRVKN